MPVVCPATAVAGDANRQRICARLYELDDGDSAGRTPKTGSSLPLGPRPLAAEANKAIEQTRNRGHLVFSTKGFWALGNTLGAAILVAAPVAQSGLVSAHTPSVSIEGSWLIAVRRGIVEAVFGHRG